jgi:hypothetical protein
MELEQAGEHPEFETADCRVFEGAVEQRPTLAIEQQQISVRFRSPVPRFETA